MKSILAGIVAVAAFGFFLWSDATAQSSVQSNSATVKYWIFFDGKPEAQNHSKLSAVPEINERALNRRKLRGTGEASRVDRPVTGDYLIAIENTGVSIDVVSRWLNAATAYLSEGQLEQVRSLPFVRAVRPVGSAAPLAAIPTPLVFEEYGVPSSRRYSIDYGASFTQLDLVNAVEPLERGINGTGVRIGILDTEYGDFTHDAFAAMVADGRFIDYQNFSQGPQTNRHGQSVASIMMGFDEGALVGPGYGAELVAATTEYAPTETNQEEDDWVEGLEWLESQGVDVVNSSLGYYEFNEGENSYTTADLDGDTGTTTVAADIAASLGVVMVNSAGNEGCTSPAQCWYFIITPADGDSVVAVGAVNADSVLASFSSRGPTTDGRTKPDVAAMGVSVRFAANTTDYSNGSGTSFASPMVAGVVAQMLQVNPFLTPVEVRQILRDSASQSNSPDNQLGWGIINADLAVLMAQSTDIDHLQPNASFGIDVFPNPVRNTAKFQIAVGAPVERATIEVYDILGRRVDTVWSGPLTGGNVIQWNPANLAGGLYVYRFESEAGSTTGSLVIVK